MYKLYVLPPIFNNSNIRNISTFYILFYALLFLTSKFTLQTNRKNAHVAKGAC